MNLENHKGGQCPYSKEYKWCQEGYCESCQIWKEWIEKRGEKNAKAS